MLALPQFHATQHDGGGWSLDGTYMGALPEGFDTRGSVDTTLHTHLFLATGLPLLSGMHPFIPFITSHLVLTPPLSPAGPFPHRSLFMCTLSMAGLLFPPSPISFPSGLTFPFLAVSPPVLFHSLSSLRHSLLPSLSPPPFYLHPTSNFCHSLTSIH